MREDVFREIESLPTAHSWPDASEGERERREKILRGIVQRIVEDGPRKAVASPERGRQFIPFAALRGYDEMIEETERHAADAEGADFAATAEKNAPPVQN
ncbi:MAG: hypothetical protein K6E65_02700 [Olsenella sp.]|nr:hypothetical protein [Olsenella sp.]